MVRASSTFSYDTTQLKGLDSSVCALFSTADAVKQKQNNNNNHRETWIDWNATETTESQWKKRKD